MVGAEDVPRVSCDEAHSHGRYSGDACCVKIDLRTRLPVPATHLFLRPQQRGRGPSQHGRTMRPRGAAHRADGRRLAELKGSTCETTRSRSCCGRRSNCGNSRAQARRFPVERLDHRAVRAGPLRASGNGVSQHALHRLEVSDLGADILQMRLGDDADLGARALALVREPEQRPDLVNRESERAGTANEVQALEMIDPIEPVAALAARRRRQ